MCGCDLCKRPRPTNDPKGHNEIKSHSSPCGLSGLLPDLCNLLFYLFDLLGISPSLVEWNHGFQLVNLLLILPVGIRKKEYMVRGRVLIIITTTKTLWSSWVVLWHDTSCHRRHELTCWEWSLRPLAAYFCFLPWCLMYFLMIDIFVCKAVDCSDFCAFDLLMIMRRGWSMRTQSFVEIYLLWESRCQIAVRQQLRFCFPNRIFLVIEPNRTETKSILLGYINSSDTNSRSWR